MANEPKKAIVFKAVCGNQNERGIAEVGEDGTVIFTSLDCRNGRPTQVVLAHTKEELEEMIGFLMHCLEDHPPVGDAGQTDNTPAEESYETMMRNLKNIH